jgi:hypothetical protein
MIRVAVCAYMATARLVELSFSRRNLKTAGESVEGTWSRRTFPAIIALHASIIMGTLLWGGRVRLPWLALLVAAQPVRAWALLSLGRRWNARGAVANDLEVVSAGPYAFVRHPNSVLGKPPWSIRAISRSITVSTRLVNWCSTLRSCTAFMPAPAPRSSWPFEPFIENRQPQPQFSDSFAPRGVFLVVAGQAVMPA